MFLKWKKQMLIFQVNSHRNRENNQNKVFNTCNTISNIYDEFNKSIDFNFFDKEFNDFNIRMKINKRENNNIWKKK